MRVIIELLQAIAAELDKIIGGGGGGVTPKMKSLSLSGVTLTPSFSSNVYEYTAAVDMPKDATLTYTYDGTLKQVIATDPEMAVISADSGETISFSKMGDYYFSFYIGNDETDVQYTLTVTAEP